MRTVITLLFSCFFYASFSQITLQPLGGPFGPGPVSDIEISPSGEYFLANDNALYRSVDGGDTWVRVPSSVQNTQTDWRDMTILPDGTAVGVRANMVFQLLPGANATTQVYEMPQSSFYLNSVQHTPDGRLFGWDSNHEKVFVSDDSGSSWQELYNFYSPSRQFNGFLIHGNGKNYVVSNKLIIRFDENGGSFTNILINPGQLKIPFSYGVAYLPDKDGLVIGANGQLKITYNDGASWDTLPIPKPLDTFTGMYYDAYSKNLFACFADTIWATDNLGATWNIALPFGKSALTGNFNLASDANGRMLISALSCDNRDLFRSENAGQNWTSIRDRLTDEPIDAILRDQKGNLYARNSCSSAWLRSEDDGKTWTIFRPAPDAYAFEELLVTQEGVLFGSNNSGGVFRSVDHGASWQLLTTFPYAPDNQLYEGGDGAIYFLAGLGNSYVSDDLGVSWTNLGVLIQNQFFSHTDGTLYRLTVNTHLERSTDHGFTWTTVLDNLSTGLGYDYFFYCAPDGTIYMSNTQSDNIFYTTDHFATGAYIQGYFTQLTADNEGNLFDVRHYGEFAYRKAGTQNWILFNLPSGYEATYCYIDQDQYLYVGGKGGGIYRSTEPTTSFRAVTCRVELVADCNDAGGAPLAGSLVKAEGPNGTFVSTATALANKLFHFFVPPGNYNFSIIPKSLLYETCQAPLPVTVPSPDTPLLTIREKASCPYLRVNSMNNWLRYCAGNRYTLSWCNEGTALAKDAYIEVELDSFFQFVSATLPLVAQNGKLLRFDLGDLAPGACGSMQLVIDISCDAALGQLHCIKTHIFPDELCLPGLDTTAVYRECDINRAAYDPNDKTAYADGMETDDEIAEGQRLEYLIRFQNTGTDTAFRVVVKDRLSHLLDAASFQPLSASHPYRWEVEPDPATGDHILRFIFDNILLPDSNINEAASHGFVKFAIQPRAIALQEGPIRNFVDIYFDYNAAVRTNTVILNYVKPGVSTKNPEVPEAKITPQPCSERALITFAFSGNCLFQLFDLNGRLLREAPTNGGWYTFERGRLASGMYLFRFISRNNIVAAGKLLVQDR